MNEKKFQEGIRATPWFREFKKKYGEEPNLDDPNYNYRAAWEAGARPNVRDPGDKMLHWDSRFKGPSHPNRYVNGVDTITGERTMSPEDFRAAFMKSRGMTLDSNPLVPTPVQTMPIAPTPIQPVGPIRMPPPEATAAWRAGVDQDMSRGIAGTPAGVPPMPVRPPPVTPLAAFPAGGAAPIPNAPAPVVQAAPGTAQGITLNSTPQAPGWAGSIGLPGTPEEAKAFEKGGDYQKAIGGLEEIAKGIKPKPSSSSDANTITPISGSTGNMAAQGTGANLLASLLQNARSRYGLSLMG